MGTLALDHSSGANGRLMCGGIDTEKEIHGKFTFSTSYATGGEDLGVGNQFKAVRRVGFFSFPVSATVAAVKYDEATGKVKAYTNAGAEIANGTNLSTVTVEFVAFGLTT